MTTPQPSAPLPPPAARPPATVPAQVHPDRDDDATSMLVRFLHAHDAPCPVCGYNLRALTQPICPECRHDLVLTVSAARPGLGWLLAALAPGFFSGIAALFVLVPTIGQFYFSPGFTRPVIIIVALDLFGWCSGVFAIMLARKRNRFIAQPRPRQRFWAIIIWLIHIAALALFILVGPMGYP